MPEGIAALRGVGCGFSGNGSAVRGRGIFGGSFTEARTKEAGGEVFGGVDPGVWPENINHTCSIISSLLVWFMPMQNDAKHRPAGDGVKISRARVEAGAALAAACCHVSLHPKACKCTAIHGCPYVPEFHCSLHLCQPLQNQSTTLLRPLPWGAPRRGWARGWARHPRHLDIEACIQNSAQGY